MITISEELWINTWEGLRKRGRGAVESAAVWGGKRDHLSETVEKVYFLDDFSGGVQFAEYHRVSIEALERLFAQLRGEKRVIVGDIHTHPGDWVGLSEIDQANPIEFRKGLCAIVLPHFGLPTPSLSAVGVHIYQGEGRWETLSGELKASAVRILRP